MYILSLENFLNVVLPKELKFYLIDFYIQSYGSGWKYHEERLEANENTGISFKIKKLNQGNLSEEKDETAT